MKKISITLGLVIAVCIISCDPESSVDVNQDKIITDYSVSYDSDKDRTKALAYFRFGSTPLRLRAPAFVTANELSMDEKELLGFISYEDIINGFTDPVVFEYHDHESRIFTNEVPIPAAIQIASLFQEYSISEEILIPFTGQSLGLDEKISIELEKDDARFTYRTEDVRSNVVRIPANTLDASNIGTNTIKITRSKSYDLQEGPKTGTLSGVYASKQKKILLIH